MLCVTSCQEVTDRHNRAMSTARRKQREFQQREARILQVSRRILIQDGVHRLSMERIAATLEYAKGTIYNHFPCKEEVIFALAIESLKKQSDLFERAASFPGRPRERLIAVEFADELFVRLNPNDFQLQQVIDSASIWEKSSEKRRKSVCECEERCVGTVAEIIRAAVAQRDLRLPKEMTPEDVAFGLRAFRRGFRVMLSTRHTLSDLGVHDPHAAMRHSTAKLLDGLQWAPLSTEYDDDALRQRIEREVFSNEIRRVKVA